LGKKRACLEPQPQAIFTESHFAEEHHRAPFNGSGLLLPHDGVRPADKYSRLGLAGKVKWSATEWRYGHHLADILRLVVSNTSRLML